MKFLAIDTSGKSLSVVAYCDGKAQYTYLPDCAARHSVVLADRIENILSRAHMRANECDFFACVVGAGSFTGIRIGISTVKGLCFACGKPALSLTSFDAIAYAESGAKRLALVGAGHGNYYACGYGANNAVEVAPAFLSTEEVTALINEGYAPLSCEELDIPTKVVNVANGLLSAALAKSGELCEAAQLKALYLRKSSAEENRK